MSNLLTTKTGKKPQKSLAPSAKAALQKFDSATINPPSPTNGRSRKENGETNGNGNGNGNGKPHRARAVGERFTNSDDIDHRQVLSALTAFKRGDFSVR